MQFAVSVTKFSVDSHHIGPVGLKQLREKFWLGNMDSVYVMRLSPLMKIRHQMKQQDLIKVRK